MDYYDDDEFEGGRKKGTKWSAAERKKRGFPKKSMSKTAKKVKKTPAKKMTRESLALPKTLTKTDLRVLLGMLLLEMKDRGL